LKHLTRHSFVSSLAAAGLTAAFPARSLAQTSLAEVKISTVGGDSSAGAWFAQDLGYFKKYGIDGNVQVLRGSGAGGVGAVLGGAVDVAEADLVALSAAHQHGLPIVVLAPSGIYNTDAPIMALAVAADSPIRAATDLHGKTIAVLSLEGPAKVGASAWLEKNGADITKVTFVELPGSGMGAALTRGTIAAATINEPFFTSAGPQIRRLAKCYDAIAPRFLVGAWFTTADWVAKNPATAAAFVHAMRESNAWTSKRENQGTTGQLLVKHTSISADLLANLPRSTYGDVYDATLWQPLIDAAARYHSIAKTYPARELLSTVALTR
jgi:NitT/TauT family transport system substrate-binding protein